MRASEGAASGDGDTVSDRPLAVRSMPCCGGRERCTSDSARRKTCNGNNADVRQSISVLRDFFILQMW